MTIEIINLLLINILDNSIKNSIQHLRKHTHVYTIKHLCQVLKLKKFQKNYGNKLFILMYLLSHKNYGKLH